MHSDKTRLPNLTNQGQQTANVSKRQKFVGKIHELLHKVGGSRLFAVGTIVLVLIAVSGLVYYNSSGRVLGDALTKTLTAKTVGINGTITFESKDEQRPVKVVSEFSGEGDEKAFTVDTKTKISAGAADLNIDLSFAAGQQNTYLKLGNAKELADLATTTLGENPYKDVYQPLADRLDNTWVKIDNQANRELSGGCDFEELESIASAEEDTLRRIFAQNQFIKAKRVGFGLVEQQYDLSFDSVAGQNFAEEFMRTEFFQKLAEDCNFNDTSTTQTEYQLEDVDIDAKMWVNPWTHELKKFMLTAENDDAIFTLEMDIDLNKRVSVKTPSESIPIEQLMQELFPGEFQQQIEAQQLEAAPTYLDWEMDSRAEIEIEDQPDAPEIQLQGSGQESGQIQLEF